ncbi:MAG: STM4015 family protein [Gallionellaceae bacterium]
MKRYFEFQDSKSYKFWQIELVGAVFTVTYGKIGSAGQQKVSEFDTEEQALKEAQKLIAEKTKKGYCEKTKASTKKVTKRIDLNDDEVGEEKTLLGRISAFFNNPHAEEEKTLLGKITVFLDSPHAADVEALVIGCWEESPENSPQAALDSLAEGSAKLPKLRELFVGDMDAEDCEISWIIQGNYTKIFSAFPLLERLHIKGSSELVLSDTPIHHAQIKALIIECGGLPQTVIQSVVAADLPRLEYLQLYLGVEDYGFDGNLDDLRPFIDEKRFPRLNYLGLVDSEIADEIAAAIAEAPILDQLDTLDLSLGVLSDAGGQALLLSSKIQRLKKLDLHYHYLSNALVKSFKDLPITVDVSQQQSAEDDDDSRYPAVTE